MRLKSTLATITLFVASTADYTLSAENSTNLDVGFAYHSLDTGYGTKHSSSPIFSIGTYLDKNETHNISLSYTNYTWNDYRRYKDKSLSISFITHFDYYSTFEVDQFSFDYTYKLKTRFDRLNILISPGVGVSNSRSDHTREIWYFDSFLGDAVERLDDWNITIQTTVGLEYALTDSAFIKTKLGMVHHFVSDNKPFSQFTGFTPDPKLQDIQGSLAVSFNF